MRAGDDKDRPIGAVAAVTPDALRLPVGITAARLSLGRAGAGMPTEAVLTFALDHARARDAVHTPLDLDTLERDVRSLGPTVLRVESAAPDRPTYLRRPDLGRRLSDASRHRLEGIDAPRPAYDVVIVIGDGLSSTAVQAGAVTLVQSLLPRLQRLGLSVGPMVTASQARVALADEIGERLGARLSIILIGERPGLSAADSLGAYLTYGPKTGRTDADRNCVSNIRTGGLSPDAAAFKLEWLAGNALHTQVSGVALKDASDLEAVPQLPGGSRP